MSVVEFHPLYMRRLADRYLKIYGMFGHKEAGKWYKEFLTKGLRARIKPYISQLAEERNLEID